MELGSISISKDSMDPENFKRISSNEKLPRELEVMVDDALIKELKDRENVIVNCNEFSNQEIIDRPRTFIREFLMEEKRRNKSLQMKGIVKNTNVKETKNNRSQKGKCYTCYPRRKVIEHIIQNENGVTFHHDMCSRNMIIVTPNNHYSTFSDVPNDEIGIIFKEIDNFCRGWNIIDYNINYNQGEWQTHKHFHLKIKTYDNTIKRMKGDHFRMVALEKKYIY